MNQDSVTPTCNTRRFVTRCHFFWFKKQTRQNAKGNTAATCRFSCYVAPPSKIFLSLSCTGSPVLSKTSFSSLNDQKWLYLLFLASQCGWCGQERAAWDAASWRLTVTAIWPHYDNQPEAHGSLFLFGLHPVISALQAGPAPMMSSDVMSGLTVMQQGWDTGCCIAGT